MEFSQLESLPRDVLFYFALEFNLPTVFNLFRTSKTLNQILYQSNEPHFAATPRKPCRETLFGVLMVR